MKTDQTIYVALAVATLSIALASAQMDYYPPMDTSSEPVNHRDVKCLGMSSEIKKFEHVHGKISKSKFMLMSVIHS